jgi:hypothetical protein
VATAKRLQTHCHLRRVLDAPTARREDGGENRDEYQWVRIGTEIKPAF